VAFDIGAGTGVLSAVLAHRGLQRVIATDMDERALGCARANIARLGLERQVELVRADLFPEGRAPLVVCNPPWLPGKPSSAIEYAIYDPDSRMLRGFLAGLKEHLLDGGEGWLILSDLAEHLGLRSREQLLGWIVAAGLEVVARHDIRPVHPKASDPDDPLAAARMLEVTSLWRLSAA
jgi:methylase of polypeptide subunit release factors